MKRQLTSGKALFCQVDPTVCKFHRMDFIVATWMTDANDRNNETSFHLMIIKVY
jgi:hypothetical protein